MRLTVRYCSAPAGRVAYSTLGAGPALMCDPGWITDLRGQLELWEFRSFLEALAQRFTVVRHDRPGCGLSDRDGADLSFDAQVTTALAVADAVGADRFFMFGAAQGGHLAAALAARHPERVEALALYGTCARGAELAPALVRTMIVALVRAHWGRGMKEIATALVNDPSPAELTAFTAFQRASASPDTAATLLQSYYDSDVRTLLPTVTTRTAVLHREADQGTRFGLGQEVAALIPDAALIPLPGSSHLFYHGEWRPVAEAVLEFFAEPVAEHSQLTDRELQVAALIAEGLTNHAIAKRLGVAPRTAETHVENIRRKLQVRSRAQIAAWVTERRLGS